MNHRPRIVVVGSANVDLTTFTSQFPRPGETIFASEFHLGFGGKGANQAVAARRCGAGWPWWRASATTCSARPTSATSNRCGIDAGRVLVTPDVSSGVAPIFVDSAGQNRILVVKGANDRLRRPMWMPRRTCCAAPTASCCSSKSRVETVYHTLRFARAHGIRSILNPAPAQPLDLARGGPRRLRHSQRNRGRGARRHARAQRRRGASCAERLLTSGVRRVIVTLGANGALLAGPEGERHVPPVAVQPVDTTGAGDAFIGSFACSLAAGCGEAEAIARANLYAALSTLACGTQSSFVARDRFEAEWSARH